VMHELRRHRGDHVPDRRVRAVHGDDAERRGGRLAAAAAVLLIRRTSGWS
jgi:hypothetical protein